MRVEWEFRVDERGVLFLSGSWRRGYSLARFLWRCVCQMGQTERLSLPLCNHVEPHGEWNKWMRMNEWISKGYGVGWGGMTCLCLLLLCPSSLSSSWVSHNSIRARWSLRRSTTYASPAERSTRTILLLHEEVDKKQSVINGMRDNNFDFFLGKRKRKGYGPVSGMERGGSDGSIEPYGRYSFGRIRLRS